MVLVPPLPSYAPSLHAGLPAYPSGLSADPGGSAKGRPCPKGAELAGPSSIPMKQLFKQLVVVRHRLRHNGKVRRRIKGTSIHPRNCQEFDCVCHKLHDHSETAGVDCQKPCRRKAFNATSRFCCCCGLSICRHFRHFCIYRW
jgi:hypothetical protein